MKFTCLIVMLILVPEIAVAQDGAHEEFNALFDGQGFAQESNNRSQGTTPLQNERGIVTSWRERMYRTLNAYSDLRRSLPEQDYRLESNTDQVIDMQENRAVELALLQETLKFAQERMPAIDKIVKTLSFEISNRPAEKDSGAAAYDSKAGEAPRASDDGNGGSRLFMKTGLRAPVDHGRIELESRTEITYGSISTFLNTSLIGSFHNTLGLSYAIGSGTRLEVVQQVASGGTAATNINEVHVVYAF